MIIKRFIKKILYPIVRPLLFQIKLIMKEEIKDINTNIKLEIKVLEKKINEINEKVNIISEIDKNIKIIKELENKIIKINNVVNFIAERNKIPTMPNYDIEKQLWKIAVKNTSEYVIEKMNKTRIFKNKNEMLIHFVKEASAEGLFLEFGVFSGTTINLISNYRLDSTVFGFDSFDGLPDDWWGKYKKGTFAKNELPIVNNNVILIKGLFNNVLPDFLKKYSGKCSFIHIDCDLYMSTKTILEALSDRITKGTIIIFDEYFNYPSWEKHEFKAFKEFTEIYNKNYEYIGYVPTYEQVAIRIL